MKKRNDKGFTLVELIVVLVILAILAAILVPALLGYIDKAREKQVTTNAEAAYVAAQALATEYYGKTTKWSDASITARNAYVKGSKIETLTDIQDDFEVSIGFKKGTYDSSLKSGKEYCIISAFAYKSGENIAYWNKGDGSWIVNPEKDDELTAAGVDTTFQITGSKKVDTTTP